MQCSDGRGCEVVVVVHTAAPVELVWVRGSDGRGCEVAVVAHTTTPFELVWVITTYYGHADYYQDTDKIAISLPTLVLGWSEGPPEITAVSERIS